MSNELYKSKLFQYSINHVLFLKPKSNITSRLRENESKFIRQLEQKDQEIMELRKEVKELSKIPKNTQEPKTLHRG